MSGNLSGFVQKGHVSFFAYLQDDLSELAGYLGESASPATIAQAFGTPTPIKIPDPSRPGNMLIVGYTYTEDELPTAALNEKWLRNSVNYLVNARRKKCPQVWILRVGSCDRPDSLETWESLMIVQGLQMTNIEFTDIKTEGEDVVVPIAGQFTAQDFYLIYPAQFSERADSVVVAEILDIMYADEVSCGTCSPVSDGTQKVYALATSNSGSPGLSSQVVYSVDGGSTWATKDIATLGGKAGFRMDAVGKYIVVTSQTDGAHHYIPKSTISTSSWTRVTGYTAGKSPRAIYVASPNRTFINAQGGYIYRSPNITTTISVVEDGSNTAQDGNDIHGIGTSIIVSVHNNNTIQYSINGGNSFQLAVSNAGLNGPESGANLTAVWVRSPYAWYVGTNTGKLWYTADQGKTWTQRTLPNQSNISVINDIKFSPRREEHGVLVCEVSGAGKVYRTVTGGREWDYDEPAVYGVPTSVRYNAVALADVYAIAVGGLQAGSDGIIAVAEAVE